MLVVVVVVVVVYVTDLNFDRRLPLFVVFLDNRQPANSNGNAFAFFVSCY